MQPHLSSQFRFKEEGEEGARGEGGGGSYDISGVEDNIPFFWSRVQALNRPFIYLFFADFAHNGNTI